MAEPAAEPPTSPTDLGARAWWGVLKRTAKGFLEHQLPDWAAALTYYGILAVFPAIIAMASLVGLLGTSAAESLTDNLNTFAPGPAREIATAAIESLEKGRGTAGVLFVVGLAGALWSASAYVGAFMRASNAIYEIEEGRPIWRTLPTRLGITVVLLVLLAVTAVGVTLTGGLAEQVGRALGVGDNALAVWDFAKWPVLLVVVGFMVAFLYWAAPNVKQPKLRWISPGGILAMALWLPTSAAFAFYVSSFGSYNRTYGALAGVVSFLVWLWISNIAVLLGAELNAELERGRRIEAGEPASRTPFAEPRDTRGMKRSG